MWSLALLALGVGEALLAPMPDAKEVTRQPPMELMAFHVPLPCPDSGEVLRFYQPRLEAEGYALCGKAEVKWESTPTLIGESLSYRSVFVNETAHKAILVSASCSLTNGRTSAAEQNVHLVLLHETQGGCGAVQGLGRRGAGVPYIMP